MFIHELHELHEKRLKHSAEQPVRLRRISVNKKIRVNP